MRRIARTFRRHIRHWRIHTLIVGAVVLPVQGKYYDWEAIGISSNYVNAETKFCPMPRRAFKHIVIIRVAPDIKIASSIRAADVGNDIGAKDHALPSYRGFRADETWICWRRVGELQISWRQHALGKLATFEINHQAPRGRASTVCPDRIETPGDDGGMSRPDPRHHLTFYAAWRRIGFPIKYDFYFLDEYESPLKVNKSAVCNISLSPGNAPEREREARDSDPRECRDKSVVSIQEVNGTYGLTRERASDDEAAFVGVIGGLVAAFLSYACLKRLGEFIFGPDKSRQADQTRNYRREKAGSRHLGPPL